MNSIIISAERRSARRSNAAWYDAAEKIDVYCPRV